MEGFRQYLGKTITLGTKKCGPGECFVGTFYTINLAEGLFVFKDVRKKTPKEVIHMKQPFVGFKLDDVTSFQLDLFANAQAEAAAAAPAPAAAPAETESKPDEEPLKPEPAEKEPAKEAPAAAKEPEKKHRLNIQRGKSPSQAEKATSEPAAAPESPKASEAPEEAPKEVPAAKESAAETPAAAAKPAAEGNRGGRGGFQRRGGRRGGFRRADDLPLQTPESLEKIKSEEYDFATASMAFEKNYGEESAEDEEAQPGAYEKDDFFDSLTSETQESHRGRGRGGRRGGRGRGRGNYNNYGRGGYGYRGGRGGGNYYRGGYNRRGRGGEGAQA